MPYLPPLPRPLRGLLTSACWLPTARRPSRRIRAGLSPRTGRRSTRTRRARCPSGGASALLPRRWSRLRFPRGGAPAHRRVEEAKGEPRHRVRKPFLEDELADALGIDRAGHRIVLGCAGLDQLGADRAQL